MHTVGSYEAKTHLPQLLERVEHGETITITRHGKPVARLVPAVATPTRPRRRHRHRRHDRVPGAGRPDARRQDHHPRPH